MPFVDCKIGYSFNGSDCVSYLPNYQIILLCISITVVIILSLAIIVGWISKAK